MLINNTVVFGFPHALYGMRNALNSHDKSDSCYQLITDMYTYDDRMKDVKLNFGFTSADIPSCIVYPEVFTIGEKDMTLAKNLIKAGGEHRKFLRFVHVQADFNLPLNIWKQWDTYHFKESLSDSTMHTGMKKELTAEDIICSFDEKILNDIPMCDAQILAETDYTIRKDIVNTLNSIRTDYMNEKSKDQKKILFELWTNILPDGYLQHRTIDTNYETLLNIYKQRRNHKKKVWHEICDWIKDLPYMSDFISAFDD